jgi:uncharacterized protein (TIGR02145 family)
MKSVTGWVSPNTGATNISGFSGLPGGIRSTNGTFFYILHYSFWWSSTEGNVYNEAAWGRQIISGSTNVNQSQFSKVNGVSIRCLRDL